MGNVGTRAEKLLLILAVRLHQNAPYVFRADGLEVRREALLYDVDWASMPGAACSGGRVYVRLGGSVRQQHGEGGTVTMAHRRRPAQPFQSPDRSPR